VIGSAPVGEGTASMQYLIQLTHARAYNAGMIAQDLLDILVCPVCKKALLLKETGESLKCTQCRRVYPVRDNIPIMLVDEAMIDPA
jgi:uncharacterized protein